VSPRTRILAIVGAAAAVAVGATIGVTVLSRDNGETRDIRTGNPPLVLDLGVRTDAEATALRRGQRLYLDGDETQAARVFARYSSPQAEIGKAFAAWPEGSLAQLEQLGARFPRSGVVQFHLGLARFWVGRTSQAFSAWRAALRGDPDSASAVRAEDFLHPQVAPGRPFFVPAFSLPKALGKLQPPAQLRELARAARRRDVNAKLLYGLALQRLGRPLSAEREYAAAAALDPANAEAQVAVAVGRYRKDAPQRAFSRLGPLTQKFPRAATVRFHLGLLLLWLDRVDEAKRQLVLAGRLEPGSTLAKESSRLLARLKSVEGDDSR
jgi:tetratricopeptide (TPR) repeat protein